MKSDVFASRKTDRWLVGTNKRTEMGCYKESQSGTKEQSQKSVLEAILPFRVF